MPRGFMSNALAWARSIRAEGVVRACTGDGRIAMIHPDDIAAVCEAALLSGKHDGEELRITGPHALSYAEMTATLSEVTGRSLRFEPISDAQARANLLTHGVDAELADALVQLWGEVRDGLVDFVSPDVERVTGRPPRAFVDWAREHAAEFRP